MSARYSVDAIARILASARLLGSSDEQREMTPLDAKVLVWTALEVVLSLAVVVVPGSEIEAECQVLLDALRARSAAVKDAGSRRPADVHRVALSLRAAVDDELTVREQSIMHLVTLGLSNKQIARELGIGPETVKTHISHVLLKLDVRNRAQAAALASSRGLIRPDIGADGCLPWTPLCEMAPPT